MESAPLSNWDALKRETWNRDQGCIGCHSGEGLECHHIVHKRYKKGYDIRNLIILCARCHKKADTHKKKIEHLKYLRDTYGYDYQDLGQPWVGILREGQND